MSGSPLQPEASSSADSKPRREGRRLSLWFAGKDKPQLEKIVFRYDAGSEDVSWPENGPAQGTGYKWTAVSRALSFLLLDYLIEGRDAGTSYCFHGDTTGQAAKSIYQAFAHPNTGIICVFTERRKKGAVCREICHRKVFEEKGSFIHVGNSWRIPLKTDFLPVDCVEVFWPEINGNEGQALTRAHHIWLRWLRDTLESTFTGRKQTAFPSLISAENLAERYGIPSPPDPFFGHEDLHQELFGLLSQKGLVVLHGLPASGKTAVAQRLAMDFAARQGRVCWLYCKTLLDRPPSLEELLHDIEQRLGLLAKQDSSVSVRMDNALQALDRQKALIVFDNYESVSEDLRIGTLLRKLADRSPVLVTTWFKDQGLDRLDGFKKPMPAIDTEKARAFFWHVAKRSPDTLADDERVDALCLKVGCYPLGIVLLASWYERGEIQLEQLEEALDGNLASIDVHDNSLAAEHRSLCACIEVAWKSLNSSPETQNALRLLSIPEHGVSVDLASDLLCHAYENRSDWHQALARAQGSALLHKENGRYAMLPFVRRYIQETKLAPDRQEWEPQVHDFFVQRANRLMLTQPVGKFQMMLGELDNLGTALTYGGRRGLFVPRLLAKLLSWPISNEDEDFQTPADAAVPVEGDKEGEEETEDAHEEDALSRQFRVLPDDERISWIERTQVHTLRWGRKGFDLMSDDERQEAIVELYEFSPLIAQAYHWDLSAKRGFRDGRMEDALQLLEKSSTTWRNSGPAYRGEYEASLLNRCILLAELGRGGEMSTIATELNELWADSCSCIITGQEIGGAKWAASDLHWMTRDHSDREIILRIALVNQLLKAQLLDLAALHTDRCGELCLTLDAANSSAMRCDIPAKIAAHLAAAMAQLGRDAEALSLYHLCLRSFLRESSDFKNNDPLVSIEKAFLKSAVKAEFLEFMGKDLAEAEGELLWDRKFAEDVRTHWNATSRTEEISHPDGFFVPKLAAQESKIKRLREVIGRLSSSGLKQEAKPRKARKSSARLPQKSRKRLKASE